jgi:anti-sigma B factor antagonist
MPRIPEQPEYRAEVRREGPRTVVSVAGEVDVATAAAFAATLRAELAAGPVLLDLHELSFMDSGGVRVLDGILREMDREGWELRVSAQLAPAVRSVLELTGMLAVLPFEQSEPS